MEYNKVYLGDCLEVMKDIPDKSIDMILCDLPYGTTACKWDTIIPFEPLWEQYKRIIKDNGAIVLTASQPFTSALVMSNIKMFKYEWIWDKDRSCGSVLAKIRPLKYHENVLVFCKSKEIYNPQMTKGKMQKKASGGKSDNYGNVPIVRYNSDTYYPRSIQTFKACHNMTGKVHPTQKPVALFEYLIKTYTNEGDLVLDNCMGSGTTGVACKNLNRHFIGIEKDKEYFKIAEHRIKNTPEKLF
jgi:site-specific DNA-methyltransferase (adenine-specific)